MENQLTASRQRPRSMRIEKEPSRGVVLIELLIVVAVVSLIVIFLISLFTKVTTVTTLAGKWIAPQFTAVGPAPTGIQYTVGLIQTTTVTPPFGKPSTTRTVVPFPPGSVSVTFQLVGAGGATFDTGGRLVTVAVDASNNANANVKAVGNGTDIVQATINYNGGIYLDTETIRFETHKP